MLTSALLCLTMAIYVEARGEPVESQMAVASVTINRTKEKGRPNTICGVVKQPGQYTWKKHIKFKEKESYERSKRIALLYIKGKLKSTIGNRTYFNHRRLGKRYKTAYKPIKIKNLVFY